MTTKPFRPTTCRPTHPATPPVAEKLDTDGSAVSKPITTDDVRILADKLKVILSPFELEVLKYGLQTPEQLRQRHNS